MLTPVPPTDCMLARESASVRLDGELSELEAARLDAHLRVCADCRAYAAEVGAIAGQLRAAPLERPGEQFVLPRRRVFSGMRLEAAVAAAAVAVAALAAGSSFTLGQVFGVHTAPVSESAPAGDMLSLRADSTNQHLLAMLPQLEPLPTARPGQLEPV
jgi:predicted anti-sigma-YlaC factor YlaD